MGSDPTVVCTHPPPPSTDPSVGAWLVWGDEDDAVQNLHANRTLDRVPTVDGADLRIDGSSTGAYFGRTGSSRWCSLVPLRLGGDGSGGRRSGVVARIASLRPVWRPKSAEGQLEAATAELHGHDRDVRTAHLAAARSLGGGWEEYLRSLIALQHNAEHAETEVDDAHGHLQNSIGMALADSNISAAEHRRIVKAATEVHDANRAAFGQRDRVVLPEALRASLNGATWAEVLGGPYGLPEPDAQNLGEWLGAIDSWTGAASRALGVLARSNLDVLVAAEAQVEQAFREGADLGPAPAPAQVPGKYPLLLEGSERPRIKRLTWWDKFVLADGWLAATARLVLAVLLPGLYLSSL